MPDTAFRRRHKAIREALLIASPTTRQGAERQMQTDLYIEAARTARASGRVEGLRHLVGAMIRGEVRVPPGSEWAIDPALWNLDDLGDSDRDPDYRPPRR